jgi:hypothetical protein
MLQTMCVVQHAITVMAENRIIRASARWLMRFSRIYRHSYGALSLRAGARSLGKVKLWSLRAASLPAALPLFATGLGGLGLLGWRRKRKAQKQQTLKHLLAEAETGVAESRLTQTATRRQSFSKILRAFSSCAQHARHKKSTDHRAGPSTAVPCGRLN